MALGNWKRLSLFSTLGALLFVLSLAASGSASAAGGNGQIGLDRAIAAQEANTDALLALDGVVGTGVGQDANGSHTVVVLLEHGGVAGLPSSVNGVPVRPFVTGEIKALHHRDGHGGGPPGGGGGGDDDGGGGSELSPTDRHPRPVPIGISTGHPDITAGTIGARVTDGSSVYALSNNHVYANTNEASIDDNVLQPGPFDGGVDPDDAIGTLAAFVPIKFDGSNNEVDAAIALSSISNLGNATPGDGYGTPASTTAAATVGMAVQKYGRTTGLTHGSVNAINVTVDVNYGDGKVARFVGQIQFVDNRPGAKDNFSAGGDSGSLIVTESGNQPVALLFAGSNFSTIGNPIAAVLGSFGVTVDGG